MKKLFFVYLLFSALYLYPVKHIALCQRNKKITDPSGIYTSLHIQNGTHQSLMISTPEQDDSTYFWHILPPLNSIELPLSETNKIFIANNTILNLHKLIDQDLGDVNIKNDLSDTVHAQLKALFHSTDKKSCKITIWLANKKGANVDAIVNMQNINSINTALNSQSYIRSVWEKLSKFFQHYDV